MAAEQSYGDELLTSFLVLGLRAANHVDVVTSTWEALLECDMLHLLPPANDMGVPLAEFYYGASGGRARVGVACLSALFAKPDAAARIHMQTE